MEDGNENNGKGSKTTLLYGSFSVRDLCKYTYIVSELDKQFVLLALLTVFTCLFPENGSIRRK